MTAPIEDVSSLPGKKVSDQEGSSIGKVKEIYATDGDGQPMWVEIEGFVRHTREADRADPARAAQGRGRRPRRAL